MNQVSTVHQQLNEIYAAVLLQKLVVTQCIKKFMPFIEAKDSSFCLQQHTTGPSPQADESSH